MLSLEDKTQASSGFYDKKVCGMKFTPLTMDARPAAECMKLYVKPMVSVRCKMIVKSELENLGLHHTSIELGWVEIMEELSPPKLRELKVNLNRAGLEILEDKQSILVDRIKTVIIEMIHYRDDLPKMNYSDFISRELKYDYTYLSNTFSEVQGITIQHFIIIHKIEKVKELLLYDQLNLVEISKKLHYSSVCHLSNQFKKITGMAPSFFKKIGNRRTTNLEDL